MKGKIIINCDDKGTHLSVNVTGKGVSDKLFVVHALGKALELTSIDYMVLAAAEADGLLDDAKRPASITIDKTEFMKQLKEEQDES